MRYRIEIGASRCYAMGWHSLPAIQYFGRTTYVKGSEPLDEFDAAIALPIMRQVDSGGIDEPTARKLLRQLTNKAKQND